MKLLHALPILQSSVGIPFKKLFKDLPIDLKTNKGNVGQLLEQHIGLQLDSKLTDFSDGELKTNKSDSTGNPRETMFITQISKEIDNYIGSTTLKFEETKLYQKIKNLVFLPVCKDSKDRNEWFFVSCHHVDLGKHPQIKRQLSEDYDRILSILAHDVKNSRDSFIHTANGEFIQIRSKDSKPYNPIYSNYHKRYISNKNHAFYFKKEFMKYCRNIV